jgi:alcohol dehydrogenase class IV
LMTAIARYSFPTEIHFGPGSRKLIPEQLKAHGFGRPLIVTDAQVASLDFFKEIAAALPDGLVYADFAGNPILPHVTQGVAAYKEHDAGSIIAIGGGAAIDVGKAIAVAVSHPGELFEYAFDHPQVKPFDHELPPLAAVPTTAGTGSEVGRSAVISTPDTHEKKIIFTAKMLPRVIFADPEVLLGLPPKVTAATGMDALTHLAEAYLTIGAVNPLCDGIALEGLRLVSRSLALSVKEPGNLQARSDMLNASLMGAVAFQKGLGAVHSCAHALSTVLDTHHGLANGVMIPYVMDFNRDAVGTRMDDLAAAVDAPDFPQWLRELQGTIGIPDSLSPLGAKPEHLERLVDVAVRDFCHTENPKPVTAQDFHSLYSAALTP